MTGKELVCAVVEGFGYRATHVAQVPRDLIVTAYWPSENHPFQGIETPVMAICKVRVASVQPVVIVVPETREIRCRTCRFAVDNGMFALTPDLARRVLYLDEGKGA